MGFFATLNPEQLGLVQRARQASEPFAIGACFDQALAALRRDFWNIVLVHLVFLVVAWVVIFTPPLVLGLSRFNAKSLRGEPAGFSDLFSGLDDFLDAWLLFLVGVPLLFVGYALCLLPGISSSASRSYSSATRCACCQVSTWPPPGRWPSACWPRSGGVSGNASSSAARS